VLIKSSQQLHGITMSISDHTLGVLRDHPWDFDLPMLLAILADQSES